MKTLKYALFICFSYVLSTPLSGQSLPEDISRLFDKHDLVAIGEDHSNYTQHQLLHEIIQAPVVLDKVDDIVVEFGNARYQQLVDNYVLNGQGSIEDLKPVWRNTTQFLVWDSPIYKAFFEKVKGLNDSLNRDDKIRVLLGDPPIDWHQIKEEADYFPFGARDDFSAKVIREEVLIKKRKALIIAGIFHLMKWEIDEVKGKRMGDNIYAILQKEFPKSLFVIHFIPERASMHSRFQKTKENRLITHAKELRKSFFHAWGEPIFDLISRENGLEEIRFTAENMPPVLAFADALMWAPGPHHYMGPDKTITEDDSYVKELLRRARIVSSDGFMYNQIKAQVDALRH